MLEITRDRIMDVRERTPWVPCVCIAEFGVGVCRRTNGKCEKECTTDVNGQRDRTAQEPWCHYVCATLDPS